MPPPASLGQVHRAMGLDARPLAVKIQYPGIASTIDSDLALLRQVLRPLVQSDHLMPTLTEVADRLREEVDYCMEAEHCTHFAKVLKVEGVHIPEVVASLSATTILTTTFMPGRPLDIWLQGAPGQEARDQVAARLQEILITGLYDLGAIHADPNPGNFIIADDLTIGLVDFGCMKRLTPEFIEQYRHLTNSAAHQLYEAHFQQMREMGCFCTDLSADELKPLAQIANDFCRWFGRLFNEAVFDFNQHPDFIPQGKRIMMRLQRFKRHIKTNIDFIFPDRTRYGLLRLFEQMGARVAFRNPYEW
jgi:predicted unusual protein kinase regulating ubiquinone biosynthesis (AarF/ABC1/UbiB family)